MKAIFGSKSVDSILASFQKTIDDLVTSAHHHADVAAGHLDAHTQAISESKRANAVAKKLTDLITSVGHVA